MFTLVEALNFRSLRYVSQPLEQLHVLVGPNASGKTTFLDVVSFLSDLVSLGFDEAVAKRTSNLREMFWKQTGDRFELAVEVQIPEEKRRLLADEEFRFFRYEVRVGIDETTKENVIQLEMGRLRKQPTQRRREGPVLFPSLGSVPESILDARKQKETKDVFTKKPGQRDNYYPETRTESGGWIPAFQLGPRRSTLANLPEDESRFPVATWFKQLLSDGVQQLVLNSLLIRRASPPGQTRTFKPDGSNLPWVISTIEANGADRLKAWVAHLRTALPDVTSIRTIERPEDKHRYLEIEYQPGFRVPSWMVSDGTLRLLALTLPAYLPGFSGVHLVEEPENGIHPRAVETMFQSLSSVYGAQMLLATHSPVVLSLVQADKVLCFAKTEDGATDIVRGDRHPRLKQWRGEENLGVLFAGGVLG
ncbi:MAG: ATP-binding protein [Phycisphaerae bacterium]|jgi:predicted ATPase|nr:ATP-binding protein [Phycisphaerae bacterium]MCZ2398351.1 ATP-binding protein [Phycisphaerae bacterium]NUQ49190.1 ATP-binding protein [Phycisphaerae bacterium]